MTTARRQTGDFLRQLRKIVLAAALSLQSQTVIAQPAGVADHAPDTLAARVLACTACHGSVGQGTDNDYFPRLAGKPAGYLVNQLRAFRSGRRHYAPMNYLLEYLPDPYLREIAAYFAQQNPPLPPPRDPIVSKDILARGQRLVTGGDPGRGVPPCAGCHNPSFTGMEPAIPGLLGLPPNYISAQLGAWRYGTRTAAEPDCMQIVAGHLTEADVTAVAAYLSTLPAPSDTAALPQGSLPMPLPCGSEPN
jgi:cytochrome c553